MENVHIHLIPLTPDQLSVLLEAAEDVAQLKLRLDELIKSRIDNAPGKYATIKEAAKILRISERSVRTYLKEKRFSYVCSGNRKLLLMSELDTYLRDNHYSTNSK